MKRLYTVIALLLVATMLLAACGADGPPLRPEVETTITLGKGGISTQTGVSVQSGPVTVGVRL